MCVFVTSTLSEEDDSHLLLLLDDALREGDDPMMADLCATNADRAADDWHDDIAAP